MDINSALSFNDRQEWRKWLEQNGNGAVEVWLVHYKKNSGKVSFSLSDGVEEALCFGWIDGKLKSIDEDKFILRYSPRKDKSVWSKINKERAQNLIASGKMTAAGLAKIVSAQKNGSWEGAYTNKTRDGIPDDLKKALTKQPGAWNNFEKFANTYRNMYIGWVISAKSEGTREKRIIEVVKRSALSQKPGAD